MAVRAAQEKQARTVPEVAQYALIEMLFFAYRDFIAEPDKILSKYGFGRAHHRVVHFVNRRPGLTVAELLDILGITKQSLNRVLKELINGGFIEQRTGINDRRQRLMFCTQDGRALAIELVRRQSRRINAALADLDSKERDAVMRYLDGLVDADRRERVRAFIGNAALTLAQEP
jgi:DNA-binding MarR family transcriptional regulator